MHDLLPVILSGFVSGSLYALMGLGFVIIYRATSVINFALGDMATVGVFAATTALAFGVPMIGALVIAMLVAGLLGLCAERFLIRPLGPGNFFSAVVVGLGLALVVEAVTGLVWGVRPRPFSPLVEGTVDLFGVAITWQKIVATAIALAAMTAVAAFFRWSMVGTAMRAAADDFFAARLVGIKGYRVSSIAWFLGTAVAALGAFLVAADSSVVVGMMWTPLFRAFAGVFLGGLHSMVGAAVGGLVIGVLDNLAGRYVSSGFRDTIVFAVIVAVMFIKPSGLLGARHGGRV